MSDNKTLYEYCCLDSAVTYEIHDVLKTQLRGCMWDHYQLNLRLLEPLLYMQCKGILYDSASAARKLSTFSVQINRLQHALNQIAGIHTPSSPAAWVEVCRDTLCFKRSALAVNTIDDILPNAKTTCLSQAVECVDILNRTQSPNQPLDHSSLGRLATLTERSLNVESKNQIADFLYRQLGLPIQYKKEHGRLTTKETTDVLALLTLYKKTKDPTLKLLLTIRGLRTRSGTLEARTDADGRIRCAYNIVGTETGRLSCYESPTGSGFNLQTVTKKDRDLFLPDPGYWFFQCDLSGADGWTVAAHCKAAGDETMMLDYEYGLKPARIIALIYLHGGQVLQWPRERLKAEGKTVDADGWLYFACKRVQHGSNYGMKGQTMSDTILRDSYKLFGEPIAVEPKMCDQLQSLYFARYPGVLRWHLRVKSNLKTNGYIVSAGGHKRNFFGRLDDFQTFKDACADEPQNNTTYATNLALYKLWTDPDNRISRPLDEAGVQTIPNDFGFILRIQPLHQVHDAICGQFRKDDTAWAVPRIREFFNSALTIAGQRIVIPFEGSYGSSWGNLKEGVI